MKLFLTIVCFLIVGQVFAQETKSIGELGLKAGININDLGGKNAGMYSTLGFHFGFYYEAVLNSYSSIQPELFLAQQGAALDLNKDFRLNYYYLNIPILYKVYFADDFTVAIGPQYGFLIAASENTVYGNENITENVRRNDISAILDIGYKYKGRTSLNLRYTLGFSNTNFQNVVYSRRLTNRVFFITLAYIL